MKTIFFILLLLPALSFGQINNFQTQKDTSFTGHMTSAANTGQAGAIVSMAGVGLMGAATFDKDNTLVVAIAGAGLFLVGQGIQIASWAEIRRAGRKVKP